MNSVRVGAIAALLGALAMVGAAQSQEWQLETFIRIPYSNSLFLARDAHDNVYGTTFNSSAKPGEVVAFKISDASGALPEVKSFDRFLCPPRSFKP